MEDPPEFASFVAAGPAAQPHKSKTDADHAMTMGKLLFMDAKDTRLLPLNQSRLSNIVHSNLIKGVFTRRISPRV